MRINSKGIGGHQSAKAISVEYYTPPEIVHALGEFDLDPCYPIMPLPWQTAKKVYTKEDDGLLMPWDVSGASTPTVKVLWQDLTIKNTLSVKLKPVHHQHQAQ